MTNRGPTAHQTTYALLRETLHTVLRAAVEAGPDALGGIGSVPCRAGVVLYLLLSDHPVDRQGRCRSCRRPGAILGPRRRRCRVHIMACYWLNQPNAALLLSQLAGERNQDPGRER